MRQHKAIMTECESIILLKFYLKGTFADGEQRLSIIIIGVSILSSSRQLGSGSDSEYRLVANK